MEQLKMLGHKVTECVTGFTGVVTSVTFDLYGCIQALVHPGLDKDGKALDQCWFDVNRLTVLNGAPVMQQPTYVASAQKGGQERPRMETKPLP